MDCIYINDIMFQSLDDCRKSGGDGLSLGSNCRYGGVLSLCGNAVTCIRFLGGEMAD